MKPASSATLAILAGGLYHRTDLYLLTLTTGVSYFFTGGDFAIATTVYPAVAVNKYNIGMTIVRGSTTQSVGLDSQEMDLTFSPQPDALGGVPLVAGYSLPMASRLGLLDNATLLFAKLFMTYPTQGHNWDPSPGSVGWFKGIVAGQQIKRQNLEMKISSDLLVLSQIQMPRNLYQGGCSHTAYDVGCTLKKATFTVTGTVGAVTSNSLFNTSLTQADKYFDLGVIKFTSGLNNGYSATVKSFLNAAGQLQLVIPLPALVANGDAFSIYPGDDRQLSTCINKFNNKAHFKGTPYVPVPETLYDGGTSNPPNGVSPANQAGIIAGSRVSGGLLK